MQDSHFYKYPFLLSLLPKVICEDFSGEHQIFKHPAPLRPRTSKSTDVIDSYPIYSLV